MRRYLLFQFARMGDLVQTKRLLLTLAREKGASVDLCVDKSLVPLAEQLYPFAQVHGLPAHATGLNAADTLAEIRATLSELQAEPYQGVYFINSSPLSYALARFFPPEMVHGYAAPDGQNMRSVWFKTASRWLACRAASPCNLIDLWGHLHPDPLPPEHVNPVARPAGTQRIGVVMAGREARRSLPPSALAACVQAVFQARGGPKIICLGSSQERPLVRQLTRLLPGQTQQQIVDMTGSTALTDLPEILQSLDCLLTPDTGTMHLGAHYGTPIQAFFLSSAWCFETGPYGLGHTVWQACTACAPCLESAPCPHKTACLAPFTDRQFLDHLSGRHAYTWPDHITGYVPRFDSFGLTYTAVDGTDEYKAQRDATRNLLAVYKGLDNNFVDHSIAARIFQEVDWLLPRQQ